MVHWKPEEARPLIEQLAGAGLGVVYEPVNPSTLRTFTKDTPDAFVIDLTRLPSHGRDVALHLRRRKTMRRVPIVFVGGAPDKVSRTRESLPDAVYTSWENAAAAIRDAATHPPDDPVVPASTLAGYSGTPMPKKLGIKQGSTVALVNAPPDFEQTLGALPEGAEVQRGMAGQPDVIILFTRERARLEARVAEMGGPCPMVPGSGWHGRR